MVYSGELSLQPFNLQHDQIGQFHGRPSFFAIHFPAATSCPLPQSQSQSQSQYCVHQQDKLSQSSVYPTLRLTKTAQGNMDGATFLSVVESCDDFPYGPASQIYYRLYLPDDDQPYGFMTPEVVRRMPWTSDFAVRHDEHPSVTVLDSSHGRDTAASINCAFARLVSICIENDLFHVLCRQHSEPSAVVGVNYPQPVFVERFASSLFGLMSRGAHLVAYTITEGQRRVWVSRRSSHLYTYPGMLDVTVGGGVKSGVSPFDTIIHESEEEASLPEDLIRKHTCPRGAISHMSITGQDFKGEKGLVVPDYIYVYDIELPHEVTPRPHDDEVDSFYCMSIAELQAALLRREFKPDSAAVFIYFLIVHGYLTAENERDYVEINTRLHRVLPFKTRPS